MKQFISILLAGLMLASCDFNKSLDETDAKVDQLHNLANRQEHQAIYNMGSDTFKNAVSFKRLNTLLKLRHEKLGKSFSKTRQGYNLRTGLDGKTITVSYKTEFHLGMAIEHFRFEVEQDIYYLLSYNFTVTKVNEKANKTVTA